MSSKAKRNQGAWSYSPRNNWKSSLRWIGPTLVSWWRPSRRGPPRVKGFNRPSLGTLMVPVIARLWMRGLRKWMITYMPPKLDNIPPRSLPSLIWRVMPPHGGEPWDKRKGKTMVIRGSYLRSALSRSLFQGIPTTSQGANSVTLWMSQMKIWNNMWGLIPNSCLRSSTCTSWIVCANLWWGFQLGPSESLRRVGPRHYLRPSWKWKTSRMWGGVTNPSSRRTTSSFTRSWGMRGNGTEGKEAQPRISPNTRRAQDSNLRGTSWSLPSLIPGLLVSHP